MKTIQENLNNLFSVAYDFMFASSGDGCSLIVCDNYVDIANRFQDWLNINETSQLSRIDDIQYGSIRFEDDQEAVVFTDGLDSHYHNMYEFIAILPNWYSEILQHERNLL